MNLSRMCSTGCTLTTRRRICKTYVNGPIFDDVDGVGGPVRSLGRSGLQPTDQSPVRTAKGGDSWERGGGFFTIVMF